LGAKKRGGSPRKEKKIRAPKTLGEKNINKRGSNDKRENGVNSLSRVRDG